MIKKLVVKEFEVTQDHIDNKEEWLAVGDPYTCFFDPETEKYYRPNIDFEVTGNDLSKLFIEINI